MDAADASPLASRRTAAWLGPALILAYALFALRGGVGGGGESVPGGA